MIHVLVVASQAESRDILRCILLKTGLEPHLHEYDEPEGALELTRHMQPDCIVIDHHAPKVDGIEFARRLRLEPRLSDVPIILIAAADDPLREAALAVGVGDVLGKPFRPMVLLVRCTDILHVRKQNQQTKAKVVDLEDRLGWAMDNLHQRESELVRRGL